MKFNPRSPIGRRSFLAGTGAVAAGVTLLPKVGWSAEEAVSYTHLTLPTIYSV